MFGGEIRFVDGMREKVERDAMRIDDSKVPNADVYLISFLSSFDFLGLAIFPN